MARALLIANPVAARTNPDVADTVRRVFEAAGWSIDLRQTSVAEDTRRFAEEAVADGVDVVAVFGGDGTTMQAAAALVGTDVGLGLVPGGTGNVLAGNLRLPLGPIQAAELILRGRSRRIDMGRLENALGQRYFGVACGAGADARVMGGTGAAEKRRLGIGGYFNSLFRVMPEIRSRQFTVTVDGRVFERDAALVMVLNCAEMIPPVVRVHRDTALDDGLFDVLIIDADTPWEAMRSLIRALANVALDAGETSYLTYARGQQVRVEAHPAEPTQFDGDLFGETPFTATVVPGAIRVLV